MTCRFQLTDDLPYLCDAPKMLLLVLSLIQCKHQGHLGGEIKHAFCIFVFVLPGYQILTDIFKMVNKDMQMELLIHVCFSETYPALLRIGAT